MTSPFAKTAIAQAIDWAITEPGAGAPAAPPAGDDLGPRRRLRLWELPHRLHCPVIGTCLTVRELAGIARRHGLACADGEPYELHVETVSQAGSRSAVARDLQRLLEEKYAAEVARFERAGCAEEVLALWRALRDEGRVAGGMWAALTHRAADEQVRFIVYGDVHMLSHQAGAGLAADVRRLNELAARNDALMQELAGGRSALAAAQVECARLAAELEAARSSLTEARRETAQLRERLAEFESGQVMVELGERLRSVTAMNEELRASAQRAGALQAALGEANRRAAQLARERDRLAEQRDALERLLLDSAADALPCGQPCEAPCAKAAGRRVLYVGGRATLLAHYRQLAERLGVRLLHHDGGREEALSRLPELIDAADAVLCPTDCVSHGAYYLLKRCCKRTGKPCLLFRGAGVSSFVVALNRLAAGQASIAGTPSASEV